MLAWARLLHSLALGGESEQMAKIKVGLLFGGCSGEHEVSLVSAKAIASAFTQGDNAAKYEVLPVYIDKQGCWHSGETAHQVLTSGQALET